MNVYFLKNEVFLEGVKLKRKKLPRYDHALRTDGGSGWVEHYLNGD